MATPSYGCGLYSQTYVILFAMPLICDCWIVWIVVIKINDILLTFYLLILFIFGQIWTNFSVQYYLIQSTVRDIELTCMNFVL